MNKTAIKNFAIWARNKLITDIQYRAGLMGITAEGIKNALPQSTPNMEFYDIGTAEPYSITGEAIRQRQKLVEILRDSNSVSKILGSPPGYVGYQDKNTVLEKIKMHSYSVLLLDIFCLILSVND